VTTPAELLGYARRLLEEEPVTGQNARLAAVLARQALESVVEARCAAVGEGVVHASMKVRLIVLYALAPNDESVRTLDYAWGRLSQACHHHAYELSPTVTEVRTLCESVAGFLVDA
jgi:hypothetical protein